LEPAPVTRVIVRWSYPSCGRLSPEHVCLQRVCGGRDRSQASSDPFWCADPDPGAALLQLKGNWCENWSRFPLQIYATLYNEVH